MVTVSSDNPKRRRQEAVYICVSAHSYLRFMVAPLRRLYCWGDPSNETVRLLQAFVRDFGGSELVELGAGTGHWSFVLARDGLLASSYDLTPCHYCELNGHHYISRSMNAPAFVAVNQGHPISLKKIWPASLCFCYAGHQQKTLLIIVFLLWLQLLCSAFEVFRLMLVRV